jgi:cellulase/cellobiase CelA1
MLSRFFCPARGTSTKYRSWLGLFLTQMESYTRNNFASLDSSVGSGRRGPSHALTCAQAVVSIVVGVRVLTLRALANGAWALPLILVGGCNGSSDDSVKLEYAKGPLTEAGVTSSLTIDDDWGSGFCGAVSIVNKGRRPVRNWRLVLQRNGADFGSKWTGLKVESRNRATVSPADHNANIPVGGTILVPFCGSGTGRPALQSMHVDTGDPQS